MGDDDQALIAAQKDQISANTEQAIVKVLGDLGIQAYDTSDEKVLEIAEHLHKDLSRLAGPQHNEISDCKYAAYWAFWIRKLKPIRYALYKLPNESEFEVTDINERAALQIAINSLKNAGKHKACMVRGHCKVECDGAECVDAYVRRYFSVHDYHYSEYLIYSLGKRTFGPHHLCAVLDAILYASCQDPPQADPETAQS